MHFSNKILTFLNRVEKNSKEFHILWNTHFTSCSLEHTLYKGRLTKNELFNSLEWGHRIKLLHNLHNLKFASNKNMPGGRSSLLDEFNITLQIEFLPEGRKNHLAKIFQWKENICRTSWGWAVPSSGKQFTLWHNVVRTKPLVI